MVVLNKKIIFSLFIVFTLIFPLAVISNDFKEFNINESNILVSNVNNKDSSIDKSEKLSQSTQVKAITWDTFQGLSNELIVSTSTSWEFGPTPSYTLTYENGTPIGLEDAAQTGVNNKWVVDLKIPLDALAGEGYGLGGFQLSYVTQDRSYTYGGFYGYSNITYDLPPFSFVPGWFSLLMESNTSDPTPSPTPSEFYIFDDTQRSISFNTTSNSWDLHIVGYLDPVIPQGRWQISLFIMDENFSPVSFGYHAYQISPPYRDFFIGSVADIEFGGFEGYKTSITDNDGKILGSVTRDVPFNVNLNISSYNDLEYAIFALDLPYYYEEYLSVAETYPKTTNFDSGWVYNSILGYYQWMTGIEGSITKDVYEMREIFVPFDAPRDREINGFWGEEKLLLIVYPNRTVNQIVSKIGFQYWNDILQKNELFVRDITTNLTDNLVVYNGGSYQYNAGTGRTSILFNLTVIDKVPKGIFLHYDVYVYDVFGNSINQLENDQMKIGIEARIANTRLFTSSGEITRETLTVQESESFRVVSELKGEYPDTTDLQAVSLSLNGWEEFWNETYNQYSFIELITRYDFIKNEINVVAYNSTERTHLVYGEYIDWEEVEYTGYHWNYTGTVPVWEYGPYLVWEEVTRTGLHWTHQFYDRVTGEWIDDWIGFRSPSNLIGDNNSNLLDILSRSVTFLYGKLIFDMNISITGNTPELYYNFEVKFEKYEFSEDYDGTYGSQVSTIWLEDQVPRINVGGEDIHVDLLDYPLYLEYNSQNYLIKEDPYIMINDEIELIQTFQDYDFYYQKSREFLVKGSWNPSTDEYERYYTLLNGTKIVIKETTGSTIYTLEFNASLVNGTDLEYLNETIIDTFSRYATIYWDEILFSDIYTFKLVNGSVLRIITDQIIQSEYWESQDKYNQTAYNILSETSFLLDDYNNYLPLYLFNVTTGNYELVWNFQVQNEYTDWESETGLRYVIDAVTGERYYIYKNTTWYESGVEIDCEGINDVYYCFAPRYIINISGFNYTLYEGLYVDKIFTITLPDFGLINVSEKYTLPLFIVKDSPQIIMLPTETMPAKYSWELDSTTSNFGVVPTIKSVNISGELVYLNQSGNNWELRLASDESLFDIVPFDAVKKDKLLPRIEAQDYWNSRETGFYIQYGKLSFQYNVDNEFQDAFSAKTSLNSQGEYEPWFLYNDTGTYEYVINHTTLEEIRVENTEAIGLWKVLINNTSIIYTSDNSIYRHVSDEFPPFNFLYYEIRAYNDTIFTFGNLDDFEYLGEYHYYPLNASYAGDPLAIYDLDGINVRLGDYNFYSQNIYLANISNQIVELEYNNDWLPVISVPYQGVNRTVSYEVEPILTRISHEGYKFRYRYESDWDINLQTSVGSIVIGNPKSNMWGYEIWTVNPDNGALDVDGELSTTNDQYFVRRIYQTTNEFNKEYSHMKVDLFWDPDTTLFDNEYNLSSIMGISRLNYSLQWSETFIWYYAENFTLISDATLANLQTIMLSGDYSAPGYWSVAWMLRNQTWEDIIAEAEENGWDWLTSNNQSYTWLDFGFNQTYYTFSDESGSDTWIFNQLITSWSGLWLYDDSNLDGKIDFNQGEISHTFIPNDIESLVFTSPGIAFDNAHDSGNIILSGDDPDFDTTIDFGIQFVNVTGKTYPVITDVFGNWASYWDWHSTGITGTGYNGFAYRPSNVSIDEIDFQMHFEVLSFPGKNNAIANLKIDQTIGNWDVDAVGARKNLENYSLAISNLVLLSSSSSFQMSDTTGSSVGNDETIASDSFIFETAKGTKFASAFLKNDYLWTKNPHLEASTTSNTLPIGQFQAIYESEDEQSSVGFKINVEMYFLAIGFPKWDGFKVFQDPVYSAYAAVAGSAASTFAPTITESPALTNIEVDEGTTVILSWVATDDDPDYYEVLDQNNNVIAYGSWLSGIPVEVSIVIISGTNTYFIAFYDQLGCSVQSGLITCTGLILSTTSSTSLTTTPTTTSGTVTVSRTSEKPKDTGIPGFTIGTVLVTVISCLLVILVRKKLRNN
ncbi:MAG: hypothetical protein HeimC3_07840 [Candidatus Heimdallarchaeota archaeon LC_3]|nr:MAG: hypothetical protein HeimC3_07840 [Candidatus Heimdallarchaeota archaeon LC_3]